LERLELCDFDFIAGRDETVNGTVLCGPILAENRPSVHRFNDYLQKTTPYSAILPLFQPGYQGNNSGTEQQPRRRAGRNHSRLNARTDAGKIARQLTVVPFFLLPQSLDDFLPDPFFIPRAWQP